MMTKKRVLSGMSAVLLAFVVLFSACENGTTDVEGTVGVSVHEAPKVTAAPVKGGVLLEWPPAADLSAYYSVWRKTGSAAPVQIDKYPNIAASQDPETGAYRYLDLVSDDNKLIAGTAYTYTVVAEGGIKNAATTEVTATPTDIPPKGAKYDPVTGVTLALDPAADTITVSWVEPAGGIPGRYNVQVYTESFSVGGTQYANPGQTSKTINWSSSGGSSQADGVYTARVTVQDFSGSSSAYYKPSNAAVSAKPFENLFAWDSSRSFFSLPSVSGVQVFLNAAGDTIAGFYTTLRFNSGNPFKGKSGVTYAVERAPLDAAGNAGTYTAVTLYKRTAATVVAADAVSAADLTADPLDNVPVTGVNSGNVYDRGLAVGGKYRYRITATKGTETQTKELSSGPIEVNPPYYSLTTQIAIAAGTPNATGTAKTYTVTPALSLKGVLQAGDKLVFYSVTGNSTSYTTGPYVKRIEFTKGELEAATVAPKGLDIAKSAADTYVFVKAYIELASGQRNNVYISSGGGVSDSAYDSSSGGSYYATLSY